MGTDQTLTEFLVKHDIKILPEFNVGTLRQGSQWAVFKEFQYHGHTIQTAHVGDWKQDTKAHWNTGLNGLGQDDEAQALLKEHMDRAREESEKEKARIQEELAPELEKRWAEFSDRAPVTPYLRKKNITDLHGCRVAPNEKGDPILIVPMRDADGKFWNYQRVYSDKLSNGDKFLKKEHALMEHFTSLENSTKPRKTYTCVRGLLPQRVYERLLKTERLCAVSMLEISYQWQRLSILNTHAPFSLFVVTTTAIIILETDDLTMLGGIREPRPQDNVEVRVESQYLRGRRRDSPILMICTVLKDSTKYAPKS